MTNTPTPDVCVIDLMHGTPLTSGAVEATQTARPSVPGMTLDQLRRNYEFILRAGAIHYPVAYQFLRELGRGRQGTVFLGLRQGARGCITEHAIKVFTPQLYRSPEEYWTDMGRIASQISRLQRVQSPNLVAGRSYEETYGVGYVQMDAVDGVDLRRLLQPAHLEIARSRCTPQEWARFTQSVFRVQGERMTLQPGVAIHIMRGILRGLECLHDANFLHCDVKPGNIMIDRLGFAKVVDLGRAVMVGEELTFLLGSPMYMAPEVHRREPPTLRSDLYSVGLVGIEMLCGRRIVPKDDATEEELLAVKMTLPQRLDSILPPYVRKNEVLMTILRKLLAPNPEERYADAAEAEAGALGLTVVDKQLIKAGLDSEYERDLSDYLLRLVDPRTGRVELPAET